jgi:hypothetical protein
VSYPHTDQNKRPTQTALLRKKYGRGMCVKRRQSSDAVIHDANRFDVKEPLRFCPAIRLALALQLRNDGTRLGVHRSETITITKAEYAEMASRDESHFFDIKAHAVGGKAIQKIAAAFSNADGGELIIGIQASSVR